LLPSGADLSLSLAGILLSVIVEGSAVGWSNRS
jgi:hypothetical protein